jgi:hypothetical protein
MHGEIIAARAPDPYLQGNGLAPSPGLRLGTTRLEKGLEFATKLKNGRWSGFLRIIEGFVAIVHPVFV